MYQTYDPETCLFYKREDDGTILSSKKTPYKGLDLKDMPKVKTEAKPVKNVEVKTETKPVKNVEAKTEAKPVKNVEAKAVKETKGEKKGVTPKPTANTQKKTSK